MGRHTPKWARPELQSNTTEATKRLVRDLEKAFASIIKMTEQLQHLKNDMKNLNEDANMLAAIVHTYSDGGNQSFKRSKISNRHRRRVITFIVPTFAFIVLLTLAFILNENAILFPTSLAIPSMSPASIIARESYNQITKPPVLKKVSPPASSLENKETKDFPMVLKEVTVEHPLPPSKHTPYNPHLRPSTYYWQDLNDEETMKVPMTVSHPAGKAQKKETNPPPRILKEDQETNDLTQLRLKPDTKKYNAIPRKNHLKDFDVFLRNRMISHGIPSRGNASTNKFMKRMNKETIWTIPSECEVANPEWLGDGYCDKNSQFVYQSWTKNPIEVITGVMQYGDGGGGNLLGCQKFNENSLEGKIVLLDHGECEISDKIRHVGDSGGLVGIIGLVKSTKKPFDVGSEGQNSANVTGYMISKKYSSTIKSVLMSGNVTGSVDPTGSLTLPGLTASVFYNSAICNWDDGDCCEKTCRDGKNNACGSNGYECKSPCDLKQPLSPIVDGSQSRRLNNMLKVFHSVSEANKFADVESPQYKAACWVIHEDHRKLDATDEMLIQRYILGVLYYATGGTDWSEKLGFLSGKGECDWQGEELCDKIECYRMGINCEDGVHVSRIHLVFNNLSGRIPFEISKLRTLRVLALQENNLGGTIPPGLGELSELEQLSLYSNSIEGSIPEKIFDAGKLAALHLDDNKLTGTLPKKIGNITSLQSFIARVNGMTGTIPEELYQLDGLLHLGLNKNQFEGSISTKLGLLSSLKKCTLGDNMFTGVIPTQVGKLTDLYTLSLENNKITGTIPRQVGNITKLEILRLSNNMVSGSIPSEVGYLHYLEELSLAGNSLNMSIPKHVMDMQNIKKLDFSNNSLSGTIPEYIGIVAVTDLDLSGNYFRGTVPTSMGNLTSLRSLHLERNNITGEVPNELCTVLSNVTEFGPFKGYVFTADCSGARSVPDLKCLCCTQCYDTFSLETEVGDCKDIHIEVKINIYTHIDFGRGVYRWELQDSSNQTVLHEDIVIRPLQDTRYQYEHNFCASSSGCYKFVSYGELEVVQISYEISMNGSLVLEGNSYTPQYFGYNSVEKTLTQDRCDDITVCGKDAPEGSNQRQVFDRLSILSGSVILDDANEIQNQAMCWIIEQHHQGYGTVDPGLEHRYILTLIHYLWKTQFGNDPPLTAECEWDWIECTDHDQVKSIDLSGGGVSATLPNELGRLQTLQYLNISGNFLKSTIPIEVANLWMLEEFDLNNNSLTGNIPAQFMHLSQLTKLNLSSNLLRGTVPLSLTSLTNLKVLDISHNTLNGDLPSNIMHMPSLEELHLGSNFFEGRIVVNTSRTSKLKRLHLENNILSGSMPYGINMLENLEELMLHNNKINGNIPASLGELTRMKKLTLSYNPLQGTIPQELNNLEKLSFLYLHGTKVTGEAPEFPVQDKEDWQFITDCGRPSAFSSPVECKSCTTCCNADNVCQDTKHSRFTLEQLMFILIGILFTAVVGVSLAIMFVVQKTRLTTPWVKRNAVVLSGEKSTFSFFLASSHLGYIISLITMIFQAYIFWIFVKNAERRFDIDNDWQYSTRCLPNSLECQDDKNLGIEGWVAFSILMCYSPIPDILNGVLLIYKAGITKSIQCAVSGISLVMLGVIAIFSSASYVYATTTTTTEVIKDAAILLFVNDLDEKMYDVLNIINPRWVKNIKQEAEANALEVTEIGRAKCISNQDLLGSHNIEVGVIPSEPYLGSIGSFENVNKSALSMNFDRFSSSSHVQDIISTGSDSIRVPISLANTSKSAPSALCNMSNEDYWSVKSGDNARIRTYAGFSSF